jgi:regulator of protease activity HflC (stomatin/prohibitin superfamily)
MQEKRVFSLPGPLVFVLTIAGGILTAYLLRISFDTDAQGVIFVANGGLLALAIFVGLKTIWGLLGFYLVFPNEAKVFTFLGRYLGTDKRDGWHWTIPLPLALRERVSLRIQNFDSQTLKVNDAAGNPIEVAAVIVWRVTDTSKAVFAVEDYEDFVRIQTETAVRHMASEYPYDSYEEGEHSLRANADEVTASLHNELQQQLQLAGVEVIRTQLRRLAYAPEIAGDMLRRQQAEAVVAARFRIVEGAVSMVDDALKRLQEQGIIEFDDEKKAAMVSNLLVVLCSEHHAQPVVNTGSLYQ